MPPDQIWAYYERDYFGAPDNSDEPRHALPEAALSDWRSIRAKLPRDTGLVLDFGAGTGRQLAAIAASGWRGIGIEPVSYFRSQSQRIAPGCPVYPDVEAMRCDYPDARFDAIILVDVLEHVPDPVRILSTFHDLLQRDGTLVVQVPSVSSWETWAFREHSYVLQLPFHYLQFTPHHLRGALKHGGYDCWHLQHMRRSFAAESMALRLGRAVFPLQKVAHGVRQRPIAASSHGAGTQRLSVSRQLLRLAVTALNNALAGPNALLHQSPSIRAFSRPMKG